MGSKPAKKSSSPRSMARGTSKLTTTRTHAACSCRDKKTSPKADCQKAAISLKCAQQMQSVKTTSHACVHGRDNTLPSHPRFDAVNGIGDQQSVFPGHTGTATVSSPDFQWHASRVYTLQRHIFEMGQHHLPQYSFHVQRPP